ncbi:MAG: GNAT family N-acetyltransferase [Planctomycetota bacterium]
MEIRLETLEGPEIAELLLAHAELMRSLSPPESCHFLPIDGLRHPAVTVWSMWEAGHLLGCGGLKDLGHHHGEIKTMHTRATERGRGLGQQMLLHILEQAKTRGMTHLFLETGSPAGFEPARRLYERHGFDYCGPFGDYKLDPYSVFMSRAL